jgi:hypothetical protein
METEDKKCKLLLFYSPKINIKVNYLYQKIWSYLLQIKVNYIPVYQKIWSYYLHLFCEIWWIFQGKKSNLSNETI